MVELNRAQRRKRDKLFKSKLTNEQFEALQEEAQTRMIADRVASGVQEIWGKFSLVLIERMRANRISEERINKIINEAMAEFENQLEMEGGKNEKLSKRTGNE